MKPADATAAMEKALVLAYDQLGRTAPNPAVGCVIAGPEGLIAGGATADGGRPHAERMALDAAGDRARGAEVFVTLEPCAHHGQTPPCAEALIAAAVSRVHIACLDPDPRTAGRGAELLRAAGIAVEIGLCAEAADELNAGFFKRVRTGLPLVGLSESGARFDAEIILGDADDPASVLRRLAEDGATRLFARPGSRTANRLLEAGLVDLPAAAEKTGR